MGNTASIIDASSEEATTRSRFQPFRLPTSMYSMKRTMWPVPLKCRAISTTVWSFTPRWTTRRYALDQLTSVDLISSVWSSPAIAHTLIGFGFANGERVVFSAEVRREKTEAFSEVGGFFKQFELVMIAATERDIVRLRTNIRGENVTLLPLRISRQQAQALFLGFANRANALARTPEFYQTVTTNCTTVIFELARQVDTRVPLDWRILLSGYLPGYLYDLGIIRTDAPLDRVLREAAISERAKKLPPGADYSAGIRAAR